MTTPWCEKYRPTKFTNIVLESQTRTIFKNILNSGHFPHLLLYGPPGAGKTTSAENIIREYQQTHYRINRETIMHLNASDERGIEVIRTQIYQYVQSNNMFEKGYKFVILDEVDYMTKNAQQALKNLIQSCNANVRFCLICNYICKLDESLKNEFICIRFNHLPSDEIVKFISHIAESEKITIKKETINTIQDMFHNDIRSMVNFIQLNHTDPNWEATLFNNELWENIHTLFKSKNEKEINSFIQKITTESSNLDINTCIKKYFHHMIIHHNKYITSSFLNICETIIHSNTRVYELSYFIYHIIEEYKKIDK